MQRLHRLGSVSLGLIIIALTCHLIAISYDRWRTSVCEKCPPAYDFREWRTSILQRCYRISLIGFRNQTADINSIINDPFPVYVCVANKFLFPKESKYADQCLEYTKLGPHGICSSNIYNKDICKCE
jgi:hypothetical protein